MPISWTLPLRRLGLGKETKTEHTRCRTRPPGESSCHSRPEPSCPRLLRREKAVGCRLAVPPARACRSKPCPAAPSRSARHRRLPRRQSPQSWGPAAHLQPGGCDLCQPTPQPRVTAAEGQNKYDLMVEFRTPLWREGAPPGGKNSSSQESLPHHPAPQPLYGNYPAACGEHQSGKDVRSEKDGYRGQQSQHAPG